MAPVGILLSRSVGRIGRYWCPKIESKLDHSLLQFLDQDWLYVRRRSCGRWVKSLPSTVALLSVNGSILTLARAYFLSGAYDRAESVLDELVPALDSSQDHVRVFRSRRRAILTSVSYRQLPNIKSFAG